MRLRAGCDLLLEASHETPLVTMLRPRRDGDQRVFDDRFDAPEDLIVTQYTDAFGNLCQRFTAPLGELRIKVDSRVEVDAETRVDLAAERMPVQKLPSDTLQFTLPSRYCPSDKLAEIAKSLSDAELSGYEQVKRVRDHVYNCLDYRYGVSGPTTDAEQTVSTGAGVCRDFAHVSIALCRALDIPARMAVGYLYGIDPMDLHAWFEAFVGGRWYTFDATEDTLKGGRIVIAYGRDAADVAFLTDYGSLSVRSMQVSVREVTDEAWEPRNVRDIRSGVS